MSIVITGACGFVGLALAEHWLAAGEDVVGYDMQALPGAAAQCYARLPGRYVHVRGDVCDAGALDLALAHHRPRLLVSLAAVTADARRERGDPASIARVNVAGAWTVLAAAAAHRIARVVHVSSGSAYGHSGRASARLHEADTALQPEALYGITKHAAEAGALRLADLYGLDVRVARLGTCFGPWEADTGVRDTLSAPLQALHRAARGEPVVLPRDSRRDWLYVRDAAAGLAALAQAPALKHRVYNVAAGFEWAMSAWCTQLQSAFPDFGWRIAAQGEHANIDYYAPYDRASMDIGRLCADTGFVPRYDLPAAADDYLAWVLAQGRAGHRPSA